MTNAGKNAGSHRQMKYAVERSNRCRRSDITEKANMAKMHTVAGETIMPNFKKT